MKYTEQAVETLDDAGSVIANKNIEIEQLRQRVQELENERDEALRVTFDPAVLEEMNKLTAERDKTHQYWQIAEGRCDALMKQRDELVAALEWALGNINCEPYEWTCEEDSDAHRSAIEAIAKINEVLHRDP